MEHGHCRQGHLLIQTAGQTGSDPEEIFAGIPCSGKSHCMV